MKTKSMIPTNIPATINGEPTQTFPTLKAAIEACVNDGVESVLTRDQIIEYINHNYPGMTDDPPFTQDVELKISIFDCGCDHKEDDAMCFTTVIDESIEDDNSIAEYVDLRNSDHVFRLWPTNNCTNREGGEDCITRMDNTKCNQCIRRMEGLSEMAEGMDKDPNAPAPAPTITELLADPTVSYWLKDAIKALRQRDILDAVRDVELLAQVLRRDLETNAKAYTPTGYTRA